MNFSVFNEGIGCAIIKNYNIRSMFLCEGYVGSIPGKNSILVGGKWVWHPG